MCNWLEKLFGSDINIKISVFSSCCNYEIKDEVLPEKYKVYFIT